MGLMNDYVSGPKFTTKPLLREIFLNLHVFTRMLFSFLLVSKFVAWYIVVKTLFESGYPRNGLLFCLFFLILYRSPRLFDDWLKKGSAKRKCKDRSGFLCFDGSYHMETSFKIAIFSNLAFFCHKIVFSVWIFFFKRTWTAMANSVSLFQFEYIFN